MTRDDLAKAVQDSLQSTPCGTLTNADIKTVVEHTLETIMAAVRAGDEVTLRGFGTFKAVERKAKVARNISKGTLIKVPARKRVTFKPAMQFRTVKD